MIGDVLVQTDTTASQVAALGLTVQRETCLLWDKTTGKPLHKAIVWQDRRTAPLCRELRDRFLAQAWAQLLQAAGLQGLTDADFADWELRSGGANP